MVNLPICLFVQVVYCSHEQFMQASMATWKHINLHGEYDFSDAKMLDSVGLETTPKNLELSPVYNPCT